MSLSAFIKLAVSNCEYTDPLDIQIDLISTIGVEVHICEIIDIQKQLFQEHKEATELNEYLKSIGCKISNIH